eukprot:GFYU01033832.1.p1 GENE.GFYU01033832.1~~GFYU01033832.1.p1  ORF type:complete len:135 (+),score=33.60 GFYU01033832.1:63-407(+)
MCKFGGKHLVEGTITSLTTKTETDLGKHTTRRLETKASHSVKCLVTCNMEPANYDVEVSLNGGVDYHKSTHRLGVTSAVVPTLSNDNAASTLQPLSVVSIVCALVSLLAYAHML